MSHENSRVAGKKNFAKSPHRGTSPAVARRPTIEPHRRPPFLGIVADSADDRALAAMARVPNPSPQDWMSDPTKLPKSPPKKAT